MSKLKKTTLFVQGMHCGSCDVLVERKFRQLQNIKEVKARFQSQTAEIHYTGHLDKQKLNQKVNEYGYYVFDYSNRPQTVQEPLSKRLFEAGTISLILFIAYFFAQELKLLPDFNTTTGSTLSYLTAFGLGLIASVSTCMATSGALFLSTVGKLKRENVSVTENIIPAASFSIGRVLSYGAFGFIAGVIGKAAVQNLQLGSFLMLFVSVAMVLIGLNMLKIVSFSFATGSSFTKRLFSELESKLIRYPKQTAFFLGAITYLLPCGFTQSVQLYSLGLANPLQSALMMMFFALGTIPALMAIGLASSFTKSSFYPMFAKVMGSLVFLIGLTYFTNALSLYGVNVNVLAALTSGQNNNSSVSAVGAENGIQEIKMAVTASGYSPNIFTIKQGVPTRWLIDAQNAFGCTSFLVAPKVGISKSLSPGENILEFTPQDKGTIPFSCSMGMFRGQINVI